MPEAVFKDESLPPYVPAPEFRFLASTRPLPDVPEPVLVLPAALTPPAPVPEPTPRFPAVPEPEPRFPAVPISFPAVPEPAQRPPADPRHWFPLNQANFHKLSSVRTQDVGIEQAVP